MATISKDNCVVFTTSYCKDKNGRQPVHVIDLFPQEDWSKNSYPFAKYGEVLGTMAKHPNTNFFWNISVLSVPMYKGENYTQTGRRKYKRA